VSKASHHAPERPLADYALRPLTLRFSDEALERRFVTEHLSRSVPAIRIFLTAASALYAVFGILDAYIIPEAKTTAWLIRYAFVCPTMLGIMLLTFTPLFARVAQLALGTAMFSAGIGIVIMTAVAEAPGNGLYYAGIMVVVIYGSSLVRLRFVYATLICAVLVGLYQYVAIELNPIAPELLLNNDFFLGMSVATGLFFGYVQELFVRRDFISNERIRQEKAIADELRIHAESANKAKSDFFAVASHELRTPLNAILGFTEIMQKRMFGPVGSERYVGYIDDIHGTARHLLSIITDILDLSKAEVGKLTLNEEEIDVVEIVAQGMRLLRERAAEAGLRLSLKAPEEARVLLRGDERLVKQVVLNLLGNSIKFTPAGGSIAVTLEQVSDGACALRVTDSGIGIAASDIPRVLEPFVQVESAFVRKHGGTGLGLPLVKKIMELHGGGIDIASTLGAGTTVTVTFPPDRAIRLPRLAANVA
jgi:two-component system, cell cycle sensor histidine kinase PleC